MKDLLGREVQVGNYICYALTTGRSANLAVYIVREVLKDKIKATKIDASYGYPDHDVTCTNGNRVPIRYTRAKYTPTYQRIEMTEEEKLKVDNKTSTLSMPERIFILDNFDKSLFSSNSST